jgi:hypothetical protein
LRLQHRFCDSLIRSTPTEISAHALAHALCIVARLTLLDQADCTHDLARSAETALQAIMRKKGFLHRMKSIALRHTFNGQDVSAVMTDGKRKARIYPSSVDDDRAGTALAAITALLRACQLQAFAKQIQEGHTRVIKLDSSRDAVHG